MRAVDVFEIAADAPDRAQADAIVLAECGPQLLQLFRATTRPQLLLTDGMVRTWRELRDRTGLPAHAARLLFYSAQYGMGEKQLGAMLREEGFDTATELRALDAKRQLLKTQEVKFAPGPAENPFRQQWRLRAYNRPIQGGSP